METLRRLSSVLEGLLAHHGVAMLTGDYLTTYGDTGGVTSAEMARLAGSWHGQATLGGLPRPVLTTRSGGSLLVVVLQDGVIPPVSVQETVRRLWDLTVLVQPDHSAVLIGLLATLRSRSLDDAMARRHATDLAVSALIDLRVEPALSEETAEQAFTRLADRLSPLVRYSEVDLELSGPVSRRALPADVADVARIATTGSVLAMLEQPGVNRIRVSWHVGDSELKAVILDDGPGALDPEALAMYRIADRLSALNGTLAMDPVPEWGTTVTASLPLEPPDAPKSDPLRVLNPREVDVLDQLTLGRRNRQIAETLHISEHTVKFHVTNILVKLAVGSRGEAAALAKTVGRTS